MSKNIEEQLRARGFIVTKNGLVKGNKPVGKKKGMNGTETRYLEEILKPAKEAKRILDYNFEQVKLILEKGVTYTPDFMVITLEGKVEFHEVKGGFIREDGKLKFMWAVQRFPHFYFALMQYKGGIWQKIRSSNTNDV